MMILKERERERMTDINRDEIHTKKKDGYTCTERKSEEERVRRKIKR